MPGPWHACGDLVCADGQMVLSQQCTFSHQRANVLMVLYASAQTTAFVPDLQRLPAGAQAAADKAAAKKAAKAGAAPAKAAKPRKAPGKRRKAGMPAARPPVAVRSGLHVLLGALNLTWQCL